MNTEYYSQIGKIVVSFQSLEFTLKLMVTHLTGVSHDVAITLTAEMSFANILNLIQDLSAIKFKDDKNTIADINKVIKLLRDVLKRRNDVIHSYYAGGIMNEKDVTVRMNKQFQTTYKVQSINLSDIDLKQIETDINNATSKLHELFSKIFVPQDEPPEYYKEEN